MYTRKDFNTFAEICRQAREEKKSTEMNADGMFAYFFQKICETFQRDNPKFNIDQFIEYVSKS